MTTAMARLRSLHLQDPEGTGWMLYEAPTGIVLQPTAFNQIATNQAGVAIQGGRLARGIEAETLALLEWPRLG